MFGIVSAYNNVSQKGLVDASDGNVYLFDSDSVRGDTAPYKGMSVYFELTPHTKITNRVESVTQVLPIFNWKAIATIAVIFLSLACSGPKGDSGSQGERGLQGSTGQKGDTGPAGQDIANVHVVRFCTSQGATVYPSHFPEYGLCIANQLFGVFDDGMHTWLAEIVPGTYQSTSTGLMCNFTVTSNCAVQ